MGPHQRVQFGRARAVGADAEHEQPKSPAFHARRRWNCDRHADIDGFVVVDQPPRALAQGQPVGVGRQPLSRHRADRQLARYGPSSHGGHNGFVRYEHRDEEVGQPARPRWVGAETREGHERRQGTAGWWLWPVGRVGGPDPLENPGRPARLDAPRERGQRLLIRAARPYSRPVRLADGRLVTGQLRFERVDMNLVGEDPHAERLPVLGVASLQPDRQQDERTITGCFDDCGRHAGRPALGVADWISGQIGNAARTGSRSRTSASWAES